jgi:hypothetical protein
VRYAFSVLAVAALVLAACDQKPKQQPAAAPAPVSAPGVAPSPAPAAAPVNLIREGVGVRGVELGMTAADVVRIMGEAPEHQNKGGNKVVFMSFHAKEIFGVYFDDVERVRMLIVARQDKTYCTAFDVCLYREGDLTKLKAHHGAKLHRFVDRDGSVTYRMLTDQGARKVMTEYMPVEERDGVVQVTMMYWDGPIDRSSFD